MPVLGAQNRSGRLNAAVPIAVIAFAVVWALFIISVTIFHAWTNYDAVPVWDHWYFLEFYERVLAGDWSAWFSQINEHRLVLDHILYSIDMRFLHGRNILLLAMDFILIASISMLLFRIVCELTEFLSLSFRILIGLFILALLFLSCQGQNITWGLQAGYWFVFFLPLCGLYLLTKSNKEAWSVNFLLACVCGVSAAGGMGNGVLALPMMAGYSIISGHSLYRTLVLAVLSVVVIGTYSYGFQPVGDGMLLSLEFCDHLLGAGLFFLTMLGSPFAYILDTSNMYQAQENVHLAGRGDVYLAQVVALILVIGTVYKAILMARRRRQNPSQTALVLYILYLFATAAAITRGRLFLGIDEAFLPRYSSVGLLVAATLLTLYAPDIGALSARGRKWILGPALVLAALMASYQAVDLAADFGQLRDVHVNDSFSGERVAILGLALGIDDQAGDLVLWGDPSYVRKVRRIAEKAYENHLSVFGRYPFRGARDQLARQFALPSSLPACDGPAIFNVETTTDSRFLKVSGWLVDHTTQTVPEVARYFDAAGREIGMGIAERGHPGFLERAGNPAIQLGNRGYIRADATGTNIIVQAEDRNEALCRMSVTISTPPFQTTPAEVKSSEVTADDSSILPGREWPSSETFADLCSAGLSAYSSLRPANSQEGSFSLSLRRGDRILYRSGSLAGRQMLAIEGGAGPMLLPKALEWIVLNFSNADLPKRQFVAKFTDKGQGGDEWSAVAVRRVGSCAAGPPPGLTDSEAQSCEGNIDRINDQPASPEATITGDLVSVGGWMTVSGKEGTTPDEVYLTVGAADGRTVYTKAAKNPRPDVNSFFGHETMGDAGFLAVVDVSQRPGTLAVGLARRIGPKFQICSNFKLSLSRAERSRQKAAISQ